MGRGVPGPLLVGDHHPDHCRVADAGERDVELAVAEARPVEEHADPLKCLPLRLVDRHRVGDADRELQPCEVHVELGVGRCERDPRDEDDVAGSAAPTR